MMKNKTVDFNYKLSQHQILYMYKLTKKLEYNSTVHPNKYCAKIQTNLLFELSWVTIFISNSVFDTNAILYSTQK